MRHRVTGDTRRRPSRRPGLVFHCWKPFCAGVASSIKKRPGQVAAGMDQGQEQDDVVRIHVRYIHMGINLAIDRVQEQQTTQRAI